MPRLRRVIVHLTAEARIRSKVSPCKIRGEQRGTEHNFLQVLRLSPRIIPPLLPIHLHLYVALTGSRSGQSLGNFRKSGSDVEKNIFTFFFGIKKFD